MNNQVFYDQMDATVGFDISNRCDCHLKENSNCSWGCTWSSGSGKIQNSKNRRLLFFVLDIQYPRMLCRNVWYNVIQRVEECCIETDTILDLAHLIDAINASNDTLIECCRRFGWRVETSQNRKQFQLLWNNQEFYVEMDGNAGFSTSNRCDDTL